MTAPVAPAPEFSLTPSVVLFTGLTGQTIRPRLIAGANGSARRLQCVDCSPWSDAQDVAQEIAERSLASRRQMDASEPVPLLVVADSPTGRWRR